MDELWTDTNKDIHLINVEQEKLHKNIRITMVQIKKLKETAIIQDTFIKNMRIEIYFAYMSMNDTMELKKFVMVNTFKFNKIF